MLKHYMTKYKENGEYYLESWFQLNIFGKTFCFAKNKVNITEIIKGREDLFVRVLNQKFDKEINDLKESLGD